MASDGQASLDEGSVPGPEALLDRCRREATVLPVGPLRHVLNVQLGRHCLDVGDELLVGDNRLGILELERHGAWVCRCP